MIYLDIDGVLIVHSQDPSHPDVKARADLVRAFADKHSMPLVISSQRRISDDVLALIDALDLTALLASGPAWKTPFLDSDALDDDLPVRGQEIQAHMDRHGITDHFVIDDDFVLAHHRHIRTDPDRGLRVCDMAFSSVD